MTAVLVILLIYSEILTHESGTVITALQQIMMFQVLPGNRSRQHGQGTIIVTFAALDGRLISDTEATSVARALAGHPISAPIIQSAVAACDGEAHDVIILTVCSNSISHTGTKHPS